MKPYLLILFSIYLSIQCIQYPKWTITHIQSPFIHSLSHKNNEYRFKRYVLRRKRWNGNKMTWKLLRRHITEADVFIIRNTLHRAFNDWSSICNLHFDEIQNDDIIPDINISFERSSHGDRYPFDGKDGVVAHAFYPRDGRLHFDADEEWTLNQDKGVNLYQTALHEIGHIIGLEHSNDPRAAMYASKRPYTPLFTLSDDDVRAARELFPYNKKEDESVMKVNEDDEDIITTIESVTTIDTTTVSPSTTVSSIQSNQDTLPYTSTTISTSTVSQSSTIIPISTVTPSTVSPMERRPVFHISPSFSTATRRVPFRFLQRSRNHERKRVRGYSMLTLGEDIGDMKKSSFFAQQATDTSSLFSFRH